MERIMVLYGGKSVEHDISIITALQVINAAKLDYEILPVYVTHEGEFFTADNLSDVHTYSNFAKKAKNKKRVSFDFGQGSVCLTKGPRHKRLKIGCAIVCMHGLNGEDGSASALLNLCNIPFSCPSMIASAVCMDKAVTKAVLKENGFCVCDYVCGFSIDKKQAIEKLSFPIIVKPARGGSSIGIQKCTNEQQLTESIKIAKYYDKKVILEHFIENGREFNCACLSTNNKFVASKVCEVKSKGLYDFDEKYLEKKPSQTFKIEKQLAKKIQNQTEEICKALECEGVVRVDYLMDENEKLFVNEINTVPGSLAFYLFSNMREIVAELVQNAKLRKKQMDEQTFVHSSQALNIFANANMNKYSKK